MMWDNNNVPKMLLSVLVCSAWCLSYSGLHSSEWTALVRKSSENKIYTNEFNVTIKWFLLQIKFLKKYDFLCCLGFVLIPVRVGDTMLLIF